MKAVVLFLAAVCLAHAVQLLPRTADKSYLIKQKSIYELFWHIDQPTVYHPELYQKARSFSIEDNISSFKDEAAVTELLQRWKHGMLRRGEVFSMMNSQHREEAITLFRVMHSAKDFETFYNTAVWARFHMNEQMFAYMLSVVVLHRADTKHIHLPPMYEVVPHLYFNEDILHQAYHIAMGGSSPTGTKKTVGGVDQYYIPANYSGWYMVRDEVPEQHKLSYFTEDVGLNAYYSAINHEFPVFMNSEKYNLPKGIRGEAYLYVFKQTLVRYYMERLSNGMGEVSYVDLNRPIATGYYPTMHHQNGLPFPQRPVNSEIPLREHMNVQAVLDSHNRISEAIDSGYLVDMNGKRINIYETVDGLDQLGNVIQGNADSVNPKYYGHLDTMYRKVLGMAPEVATKHNVVPTALDFYATSQRDPVFYEMMKNIVTYWMRYKHNLPSYTQEELGFPGVSVESVTVDKLMTFFDTFDSLLSNALSVRNQKEAWSMLIKARQYRLNHKPFTFHITVNSDKNVTAVIRIFIGPKYDVHGHELDMTENYMNFLEVDQWVVELKSGANKIDRHSHQSVYLVPDEIQSEVMYKNIVKAIEDNHEKFTYMPQLYGFPHRLILPKGSKDGMPLKVFVSVSPFDETKSFEYDSPVWGPNVIDGTHSLGYPLDRPVRTHNFNMPNFYMKDVMVYHKQTQEEMNMTV